MKKNKTAVKENYLDRVPVFNGKFSWKQGEDGIVTIYMENTGVFNRIFQKFFHKPEVSQIHLDQTGSFILPLIDGKRSIYDIALLVREQFGEKAEPLYERLVTFMRMLEDYRFVTIKPERKTEEL